MGIALATVLIQFIGCIYLGVKVFRTGLISNKSTKDIFPKRYPFMEIARQGLPASLNMLSVGLGIFVIVYFISKFGEEAVAAYGIATRVEQIVLLPTIGLNIATLTIVAHNNGAQLFHRIRETLYTALKYGGTIMSVGTIAVFVFSKPLMGFFSADMMVIEIGTTYLKIAAFVLYAYVILYVHVAALQGMKKPGYAVWLGLLRQIIAPIITFYVLTDILDLGIHAVWWGIFFITWAAAGVTTWYAQRFIKKVISLSPAG
jgi:Na+-driven multidrug efflux pump